MARRAERPIESLEDLRAWEGRIDASLCGRALTAAEETRFRNLGAHDYAPTPYFVLEELFAHFELGEASHLLDVGCGTGRVLAHFVRAGCPGRATGIELDPELAGIARTWTATYPRLDVIEGSVLDADLSAFTDFYLYNPFDQGILQQFIQLLEIQATRVVTLVHMSDNGDSWCYAGRPGWTELASGSFSAYQNGHGRRIEVYDWPQHYTVWHHDPGL